MNYQFMRRSHVLLPTMPSGTTRTNRRAATATEARNSNPSGARKSNRVSTWHRIVSVFLMLMLIGIGKTLAFEYKSSVPANGSSVPFIEEIEIIFDLEPEASNVSNPDWHIGCNVWDGYPTLALMHGDEILAQVQKDFRLEEGDSFTVKFDTPVILVPGEEYKLISEEYAFSLYSQADYKGYVVDTKDFEIVFYGSEGGEKYLLFQGAEPENNSSLEQMTPIELFFNEEVDFNKETPVSLFEKGIEEPIAQAYLSAGVTPQSLTVDFGNITLYNTHNYSVVIPENTIYLNGETEEGYKEITLNYTGLSYMYFGYGRKYPANNKTSDYLSELQIAVDCSESQYLGRDFKPKATLYKVENDDLILVQKNINCVVDESAKGFYIQIFDFDLEPASTYQVVIEANSFKLWTYTTQKPLYDTANEKLVLTYHTPEIITPLPRQGFGVATPAEDSAVEKLEAFKLTFENYNFDGTFYYPVFAGYQEGYNVVKFMDETTGEEMGTFEVDIKWIGDQDLWLENVSPLDFTLLEGHTYNVVIPAGMFCCRYDVLHDLTLNEEYTVTYKGATSTMATVTCSYGEAFSIANVINRGESATLRFTPSEEWAVDTVTVNGEEAELTDGVLILSDVTEDMNVSVSYKFIGGISFNYSTGVDGVEDDCPYFVALGESYVALSGLEIGSTVEVYNTVGMLLGTSVATDSEVKIDTVPGLAVVVIRKTDAAPVAITVRIP